MFLQRYLPHELQFAYCYRLFLRVRTQWLRPYPELSSLHRSQLRSLLLPYSVRVLEFSSDPTNVLSTLSLLPNEAISAAASKVKGRVSNWLREALMLQHPTDLLSRGYFACTIGKSRRRNVERYLSLQAEHHGYSNRILPPVYEKTFLLTPADLELVSAKHSVVISQFHIVLSTTRRQGIFGSSEGELITNAWRTSLDGCALIKVSFVPDHIHVAVRLHPSKRPSDLVVALMDSAQEMIAPQLISAGINRLWQPSAYMVVMAICPVRRLGGT